MHPRQLHKDFLTEKSFRTPGMATEAIATDEMDISDEDGGVPINDTNSDHSIDIKIESCDDNQIAANLQIQAPGSQGAVREIYHQNVDTFTPVNGKLWRLPVQPVYEPDRRLISMGYVDVTARKYHSWCRITRGAWKCEPEHALPKIMHESTPYSMALLLQLRRLASHSKGDRQQTHAILTEKWRERLARFGVTTADKQPHYIELPVVGANDINGQWCEPEIRENVYGCSLEDVAQTMEIVLPNHKTAAKSKRERRLETVARDVELHGIDAAEEKYGEKQVRKAAKAARRAALKAGQPVKKSTPQRPTEGATRSVRRTAKEAREFKYAHREPVKSGARQPDPQIKIEPTAESSSMVDDAADQPGGLQPTHGYNLRKFKGPLDYAALQLTTSSLPLLQSQSPRLSHYEQLRTGEMTTSPHHAGPHKLEDVRNWRQAQLGANSEAFAHLSVSNHASADEADNTPTFEEHKAYNTLAHQMKDGLRIADRKRGANKVNRRLRGLDESYAKVGVRGSAERVAKAPLPLEMMDFNSFPYAQDGKGGENEPLTKDDETDSRALMVGEQTHSNIDGLQLAFRPKTRVPLAGWTEKGNVNLSEADHSFFRR